MAEPIDGGGPAFPQKEPLTSDHPGMSLHDWFAGMALQGILANQGMIDVRDSEWPASFAMECADAMLAAKKEALRVRQFPTGKEDA